MSKKDILSTPKHGWCSFHLADEEKEFNAALSYLTDIQNDLFDVKETCCESCQYNMPGKCTNLDRGTWYRKNHNS